VNDALTSAPEQVNQDAYAAWLFRLRPTDPTVLAGMVDAAAYTKKIADE